MEKFDVYKERRHSIIQCGDKEFKIPSEYTVEEAERILELQIKQEKIQNEIASDDPEKRALQLQSFYKSIFSRLEIMIQHFQPEVTEAELRNLVTHDEALTILDWFEQHRYLQTEKDVNNLKKKLN